MKQFWCTSKTVWWMFRVFSCGAAGNRTLFFLLFGYVLFAFVSISGVVHLPFTVFVRRAEEKKRTQKAAVAKQKTADGGEETPPPPKKKQNKKRPALFPCRIFTTSPPRPICRRPRHRRTRFQFWCNSAERVPFRTNSTNGRRTQPNVDSASNRIRPDWPMIKSREIAWLSI